MKRVVSLALALAALAVNSFAAPFVVTTNADSGPGSLRQAILDANAVPGADAISFNIIAGSMIIQPATTLPKVTTPTSIDGLTQSGSATNTATNAFNGTIPIRIDGSLLAGSQYGLEIVSTNCLVRGLSIYNFRGADIGIRGVSNVVESCLLGVSQSGGYGGSGIYMSNSVWNIIGGATVAARNVISGNGAAGIHISRSHGNVVLNNFIGTDETGALPLPNAYDGIYIELSSKTNVIGGATFATRNVISGNSGNGVSIWSGMSNVVQGNYIGTDAGGTLSLGNFANGVMVNVGDGVIAGTFIGGTDGQGNTIAFNGGRGVSIATGLRNGVWGNGIYSNAYQGIALGYFNSPNDAGDIDTGPNDLQNTPVLTNVVQLPFMTRMEGRLNSRSNGTYRIEFFDNTECDQYGLQQGRTYLGFANVTCDSLGNGTFTFTHLTELPFGHVVTATATDTNNNTSGFSFCQPVVPYNFVNLGVTLSDSADPVSLGALVNYSILITNSGPTNATGVVVTNQLPAELNFVSAIPSQGACSNAAGLVICHLATIANGAAASITIEAAPTTNGLALNTVTVSANELDHEPSDNSAIEYTQLGVADIAVLSTHTPEPVVAGQNLTYEVTATNLGPDTATEVVIALYPDPSMVVLSASTTQGFIVQTPSQVDASVGSLPPGGSARLTVTVLPTQEGTIGDNTFAAATQADPDYNNNYSQGSATVQAGPGVLAFQSYSHNVSEGAGSVLLAVVRSGGALGTVTVDFATSNLTATAGNDFTAASGTITFTNGETTKNISVPIVNDVDAECNEQFLVSLHNPGGGAVLPSAQPALVLIFENDLVPAGQVEAASVAAGPMPPTANGYSSTPLVSANGRFVCFSSQADNLVANDSNGDADIFVRDLSNQVTVLVSANLSNSDSGAGRSEDARMSANSRRVAFTSLAPDLVAGDTNGAYDIFLRDLDAGTNILISVNHLGSGPGDKSSFDPAISADGRFVAFSSLASNLVTNDLNGSTYDVFLRDTLAGTTELISVNADGTGSANKPSFLPAVSPDGRYVAFRSEANDFGPTDTNETSDVYLRDRLLQTNILVSARPDNSAGNAYSDVPVMSANGKVIVFRSEASDLAPGDTIYSTDIFAYDIEMRTLRAATVNHFGTGMGNGGSFNLSVSADGRFVAFDSQASDLVPNDLNGANDVFVRDLLAGTTTLVSVNCAGSGSANLSSAGPAISADGRFVSFSSAASDLTAGQFTGVFFSGNIFRRDLITGETVLITMNTNVTGGANAESYAAQSSADGRVLAFSSGASDLVSNDLNGTDDIFVWSGPAIPPIVQPALTITTSNALVFVRWPSATPGLFLLESAANLNPVITWSVITHGITNDGTWKSYVTTNAMPDPERYFRLRY